METKRPANIGTIMRKSRRRDFVKTSRRRYHTRSKVHASQFEELGRWYWWATSGIVKPGMPLNVASFARFASVLGVRPG